MQMCYRGVRYESNSSSVQVETKHQEGKLLKFRGCSYQPSYSAITLPQAPNTDIVYRGVSVATGKEIRFLGRTCEQRQIVLCSPVGA